MRSWVFCARLKRSLLRLPVFHDFFLKEIQRGENENKDVLGRRYAPTCDVLTVCYTCALCKMCVACIMVILSK